MGFFDHSSRWAFIVLVTLLAQPSGEAAPHDVLSPYAAQDWLAFVVGTGARTIPGFTGDFFKSTPKVIVFRDGRIVWRVGSGDEAAQPEWRSGRLPKASVDRLLARARASRAVTSRRSVKEFYGLHETDRRNQTVGVCIDGSPTIFHPWTYQADAASGEGDPKETSIKAVGELGKRVTDLITEASPRGGVPFIPDEILVQFVNWGKGVQLLHIQQWPLPNDPLPSTMFARRYSGGQARAIVEALKGGHAFTDGKQQVQAYWRPALDAPYVEQPYEREQFTPRKWRVARQGAIRFDEKGERGFLYRWHMVKDLLQNHLRHARSAAQVNTLLGRPDRSYAGADLRDFGSELLPNAARAKEWDVSGLPHEPARRLFLVLYYDRHDRLLSAGTLVH